MPIKDRQLNKEYQREWARRKRAGLPTRTTPKRTKEEQELRRREYNREWEKMARQKKKILIENAWGTQCSFCPRDQVRIIHRKDGKPHKLISSMGLEGLKNVIKKHRDEYIRVCGICHAGLHWCMNHLGFVWDDVRHHLGLV